MENPRISRPAMCLLRGTAIFATFFFVRLLVYFLTLGTALQNNSQLYMDFPLWVVGLIVLVGTLFLYNSLVRHFALYDVDAAAEFFESPVVGGRLSEYRAAFCDRTLILTTLPSLLLVSLFLPLGIFYEAELLFEFLGSARDAAMYAVYLPSFVFSAVNSRYETRRHWRGMHEARDTKQLRNRIIFTVKLAAIVLVYPFAIPLSPILFFLAVNVFSIAKELVGLFSTIGLVIVLIIIAFLIFARPKLHALSVRRKFEKRLRLVASRAGYGICDIKKEGSLASGYAGALSFVLTYGERKYTCRMIPIEHRRRPIYFTDEKNAHFLIRLGTKKHFISMTKHFEYAPTGEGKKIVILAPEPKYVFVCSDGAERRLYTGDAIWQSAVYEPDSFFGSLDRHCLDKVNGLFD